MKTPRFNAPLSHLFIAFAAVIAAGIAVFPLSIGETVANVTVRDASDRPTEIPNLGKKNVLIFYVDPDVPDQNDPFSEELKRHKFPVTKFFGMGIVNLKDAPLLPNSIVRAMVRREMRNNDNAVILTDPDRTLQREWGLGDCNNKSVIILIDQARRVRYFKKGALTASEIDSVIATIAGLVK